MAIQDHQKADPVILDMKMQNVCGINANQFVVLKPNPCPSALWRLIFDHRDTEVIMKSVSGKAGWEFCLSHQTRVLIKVAVSFPQALSGLEPERLLKENRAANSYTSWQLIINKISCSKSTNNEIWISLKFQAKLVMTFMLTGKKLDISVEEKIYMWWLNLYKR